MKSARRVYVHRTGGTYLGRGPGYAQKMCVAPLPNCGTTGFRPAKRRRSEIFVENSQRRTLKLRQERHLLRMPDDVAPDGA
jgi:hypothetical protein